MKKTILILPLLLILFSIVTIAQTETIQYELNGRNPADTSKNPFSKFIGEWTLKNDSWTHNWGGETESIKIPNHHTISKQVNTNHSLLSIIDGPEPNGHIFWSFNPNTKEVQHLSSFGEIRAGKGKGTINENGDVRLKLIFEGEPEGTYRIYNYKWLNNNEYHMKSVQYSQDDEPTGLFYEGNFVRIKPCDTIEKQIENILSVLDDNQLSKEEQLHVYADDIVHMAPNSQAITNKKDLLQYLIQQKEYGYSEMKHKILEYSDFGKTVLMQGQVEGTFYPNNGDSGIPFTTKNLFVFRKEKDKLKITKVIYNMSPNN